MYRRHELMQDRLDGRRYGAALTSRLGFRAAQPLQPERIDSGTGSSKV